MNALVSGLPLFEHVDVCARRHGGSPDSRAAFREHHGGFAKRRAEVMAEIRAAGAGGLTAKELARIWDVGLNTISGRFSELKANHEIVVARDGAGRAVRRDGCAAYRAVNG